MPGIIEKIAGIDKIRGEMRSRVNEILKCGTDWQKTARELAEALDRLTEAIERNRPDIDLTSLSKSANKLSKDTKKLIKALNKHSQTLSKIGKLL